MTDFAAAFRARLDEHNEHPWEQVGRCVYCVPCGRRLYQGTIPEGHPTAKRQVAPKRNFKAEFDRRWGVES